jgi:hypothetical protein
MGVVDKLLSPCLFTAPEPEMQGGGRTSSRLAGV